MELHDTGFIFDFYVSEGSSFRCVQDNSIYPDTQLLIRVIDQCYDQYCRKFKYVHTIETFCGKKGLLLTSGIYTNS
jgi:hypothetical protein